MELLRIENLQVYYGPIHAVKNVSFHLEQGEILSLIGANGAGKSTILKTISGIQPPKSGSVYFEGTDITHMPPHKIVRKGLVHMTCFPLRKNGRMPSWRKSRSCRCLSCTPLRGIRFRCATMKKWTRWWIASKNMA